MAVAQAKPSIHRHVLGFGARHMHRVGNWLLKACGLLMHLQICYTQLSGNTAINYQKLIA